MTREFLDGLMQLPEEVAQAILAEHEKHRLQWQEELQHARLEGAVGQAVARAGGRNQKAIAALLDMQALQQSEDVGAAVQQAVEDLKKECGYLFDTVPGYAVGTGAVGVPADDEPQSLAGALREKFAR